ncbi:MAG: right-handed parallel beta-helix repeat-containing protein [Deltaproteobacteria bacterium]|nr:right-handed parallel beta-helix repeat-containing protein [Deltaproteobacteria bacterium]
MSLAAQPERHGAEHRGTSTLCVRSRVHAPLALVFTVMLVGCARFGFDPSVTSTDGADPSADVAGVAMDGGLDGSSSDHAQEAAAWDLLQASPSSWRFEWLEAGDEAGFVSTIRRVGGGPVGALSFSADVSWLSAQVATPGGTEASIEVHANSTGLAAGEHQGQLVVSAAGASPTRITVELRVVALPHVHVGMSAEGCPHLNALGQQITACDYAGTTAVVAATAAISTGGARILIHDDGGQIAHYVGCVSLPAMSWIGAAEGVPAERVLLECGSGRSGAIQLTGDGSRVERLSIFVAVDGGAAISAWNIDVDAATEPPTSGISAGHLIENVRAFAVVERVDSNGIKGSVYLGAQSTVRNCYFSGFFQENIGLRAAHGSRVINNSFVTFEGEPFRVDAQGVRGLIFANNVVVSPAAMGGDLMQASAETEALSVVDNVFEGVGAPVVGLEANTTGHVISGNHLGLASLESPLSPRILADANYPAGTVIPGEGRSLDGVSLAGRHDILPGAFQERSAHSGRRMVVRVGESCGAASCDFTPTDANELQRAVWSVWPGGVVEVYPAAGAYAGQAIIAWPLTLRGMGTDPAQVVLDFAPEPSWWQLGKLWDRLSATLAVQGGISSVTIENLTVVAGQNSIGLWVEDCVDGLHHVTRLRVLSTVGGATHKHGMLLGDGVLAQDTLISGDFASCVRFGPRPFDTRAPGRSTSSLVNLSCQLATIVSPPEAAFDVGNVLDALFINVAVEADAPIALFRAQRRSAGDTGITASDPPLSFRVEGLTMRGVGTTFDGFDDASGTYTLVRLQTVAAGAPFFAADGSMVTGSLAIDAGVNPATIDSSLKAGVSVNGVSRSDRLVDHGAFEQGL